MSPVLPVTIVGAQLTGNYPHMSRRDAPLWERFLELQGAEFTGFSYDVAFGGSPVTIPEDDPELAKGWHYLTAVKVDAVGYKKDETWMIEVKPSASLSAVGQALGAVVLGQRETFSGKPLVPVILTDNLSVNLQIVAQQLAIQLVVIPEPPPG